MLKAVAGVFLILMETKPVIAGLDPAIHPVEMTLLFDGCAGVGERKRRRSSNGYARA
jgi:hypothetical protein